MGPLQLQSQETQPPSWRYEEQWGIKNRDNNIFKAYIFPFQIPFVLFSLQKGAFCYFWLFSYKELNGGAKPALFPHNQGCAYEFSEGLFVFSG